MRTKDGVETVDSTRTVERSESKGEDAAAAAGWCSLRTLLVLLLVTALAGGLYYILVIQKDRGGFSAEKV